MSENTASKMGRNTPCHCGSGKKFKQCCLGKAVVVEERSRLGMSLAIFVVGCAGGGVLWFVKGIASGLSGIAAGLIVAAAVYVFRDPNPPRSSGGNGAAINFGK